MSRYGSLVSKMLKETNEVRLPTQLYKRALEQSKVLMPHYFLLLTNIVEDSDKNLECLRRGSGGVVPSGPIGCHLIYDGDATGRFPR